jgi:hypothetical protein
MVSFSSFFPIPHFLLHVGDVGLVTLQDLTQPKGNILVKCHLLLQGQDVLGIELVDKRLLCLMVVLYCLLQFWQTLLDLHYLNGQRGTVGEKLSFDIFFITFGYLTKVSPFFFTRGFLTPVLIE